MGNSSSKSAIKQESNTLVVNKSTINSLNQLTTSTSSNSIVKMLSSCKGEMTNINTLDFGGTLTISGGSSVTLNQSIKSDVNFKCLQQQSVQSQIKQEMSSAIYNALQNSVSNDILTQLDAQAQSASQAAFASLTSSKSDASVDTKSNTEIINQNEKTVKNVIDMAVSNNFTQETINSCISSMLNQQIASFKSGVTVTDKSTLVIDQNIATSQIQSCIQNSSFSSDISNSLVQFFQLDIKDDTTTAATTEQTGKAESESKVSGFFEDIGQMFKGIGEGLGSILGIGAIGTSSLYSSSCCCSIICCIIFFVIIFFVFKAGDDDGPSVSTTSSPTGTSSINLNSLTDMAGPKLKNLTKILKK